LQGIIVESGRIPVPKVEKYKSDGVLGIVSDVFMLGCCPEKGEREGVANNWRREGPLDNRF